MLDQNLNSKQDVQYPLQVKTSNDPKSLVFDSAFESGNLFAAFRVKENEYDLILQNDINTKGNTQWFFFSVGNTVKNTVVKFNIVNLVSNIIKILCEDINFCDCCLILDETRFSVQ